MIKLKTYSKPVGSVKRKVVAKKGDDVDWTKKKRWNKQRMCGARVERRRRTLTLSGPSSSPCTGHTWAWGWACLHLWYRNDRPVSPGKDRGRPSEGG